MKFSPLSIANTAKMPLVTSHPSLIKDAIWEQIVTSGQGTKFQSGLLPFDHALNTFEEAPDARPSQSTHVRHNPLWKKNPPVTTRQYQDFTMAHARHIGDRKIQQDTCFTEIFTDDDLFLSGVFDGHGIIDMGVNEIAIERLRHFASNHKPTPGNLKAWLTSALEFVDNELQTAIMARCAPENLGKHDFLKYRQGTTASIFARHHDEHEAAWIGDSPIFSYDAETGNLSLLISPHESTVEEQIAFNMMCNKVLGHPDLKAAGTIDAMPSFVASHNLLAQSGDYLVICSDGLTNYSDTRDIETVLAQNPEPAQAVLELMQLVSGPGQDNISIVVIKKK